MASALSDKLSRLVKQIRGQARITQDNVGFEQSHAHFTQHIDDVVLRDARVAADLFDEAREFVGESGGHKGYSDDRNQSLEPTDIGNVQNAKL